MTSPAEIQKPDGSREYELLLQAYKSGQITEAQWRRHLDEDPAFAAFVQRVVGAV